MSLQHVRQYATDLARGAGRVILDHYGKVERLTKTHSATTDEAVTDADRASQRYIVAGLRQRYPTDGLIGEESDTGTSITAEIPNPQGRVWVIDPIDGTNNFISGLGNFAVCIGLLEAGAPILGVVYDVCRDEMYCAARGQGAWRGTKSIAAPNSPLSDSSMLMMTSNLLIKGRTLNWACHWIGKMIWKVRMLGSAALECVQGAAGVAHGAVTVNGKLWDVAAPAAILLEAGGRITDLQGGEIFPFDLTCYQGAKVPFLAAGPSAHVALLREIHENP